MMKIRILFPAVILAVIISLIITTMGYPEKARLFPLLVALPVAVLLALDILREAVSTFKKKAKAADEEVSHPRLLRQYLSVVVWLIFFALAIYLLGLLAGATLYLFLYLKMNGEKWSVTLIYVIALLIVMYGVFELAFGIPLYRGVLFE